MKKRNEGDGTVGERDAGTGNRHEGGGSMEMNVGRGLWGKGMQGGDCGERDAVGEVMPRQDLGER